MHVILDCQGVGVGFGKKCVVSCAEVSIDGSVMLSGIKLQGGVTGEVALGGVMLHCGIRHEASVVGVAIIGWAGISLAQGGRT